jgi:hypothetical protein
LLQKKKKKKFTKQIHHRAHISYNPNVSAVNLWHKNLCMHSSVEKRYSVGGLIPRVLVPHFASIGDPGWFGFTPTDVGNLHMANAGDLSGQWQI